MALHLAEIHLRIEDAESAKAAMAAARRVADGHLPEGFRLVAGPWMSNEEPKLVLVLDFDDHTRTLDFFWPALARGTVTRRRFTPLVELDDLAKVVETIGP